MLSKQLLEIRETFLSRGSHCGFLIHSVKEILSIVRSELSVNDLKSKTSVFNVSRYQLIIDIVKVTCTNHSAEGKTLLRLMGIQKALVLQVTLKVILILKSIYKNW